MDEVAEIKQRLPIEQVVGQYIPLKRAGRNFKGLSPFKPEKTPSFIVSPDKGIYKDFSSGEGGDIFDFVMRMDGLTFPEALKVLAEKAGVELPERRESTQSSGPSKQRIFALNEYAAKLWHTILMRHPQGARAKEYLHNRGLTDETIKIFQIGYAPAGDVTAKSLAKEQFNLAEIGAAGDPTKFRNRVVFPLHDITGKTIGFTGRILDQNSSGPKYWNTPETPVYHKSRVLFGLHTAKHAMREMKFCLLVEGQMDVCMLHQFGFTHTVASSGTALTTDQLTIIKRFTNTVVIAYDSDPAGIAATKKAIELCLATELNPLVISTGAEKDPADLLQQNPEHWNTAYKNRQSFMQWLIETAMQDITELTPLVKKELSAELAPWIPKIPDQIERTDWSRRLASRLQVNEEHLQQFFSSQEIQIPSITKNFTAPVISVTSPDVIASLLLTFPALIQNFADQLHSLNAPISTFAQKVFSTEDLTALPEAEKTSLAIQSEEILEQKYANIAMTEQQAKEEIFVLIRQITSHSKEELKTNLAREISQAEAAGDKQKLHELFIKLKNLL